MNPTTKKIFKVSGGSVRKTRNKPHSSRAGDK